MIKLPEIKDFPIFTRNGTESSSQQQVACNLKLLIPILRGQLSISLSLSSLTNCQNN